MKKKADWGRFVRRLHRDVQRGQESMRDGDEVMWVSGGVDDRGHVIGHPCSFDDKEAAHTPEEKALTTWRWSVLEQDFMAPFIPPKRFMIPDEVTKVRDWLFKQGYMSED